ncbi:complex I subunit 4 family protein [Rubricoccus marinus]|uniref:NADH dehydrogenase n=1 Tax=Rubricoccus marinus TaxID=716817 RepID=A0A259TYR4_9BACT|nr:NADH-quinone oxidoreductase subunit M [Rubricoccus marinus]OZC02892.1 NADH dehydrogenase [Rubricoccus marinus]
MSFLADIPNLVSLVIFLPALGALAVMLAPSVSAIRWISLAVTTVAFVLSLGFWFGFDASVSTANAPQLREYINWLPGVDVNYHVGVDGLNLLLLLLTTLLGPIVVLSSWHYIGKAHKGYYALILLLETGVLGVFAAFDVFLFYVFFELTLIPMVFIIGIWGGEDRIYAATKFVIYTLVGSLLMLVGVLWLGFAVGEASGVGFTTDWYKLVEYGVPLGAQTWLFLLFGLAFAIKVPLFPLHTWLPDAHTQAPTGGSVVLAGVLLKMGTYGLLRFVLPFFPNASLTYAPWIGILAVIGIVYGALVAFAQTDVKKLVAYSSVSHLGFVVLGIFAFDTTAVQGALIQMVNHGISTGALFLIIGMMYERRHTRAMADYGGIAKSVPVLTFFMLFSVFASAGLPGLNGFVGEFMILVGSFTSGVTGYAVLTAIAASGVIFAAVYLLWMVYRTFFGEITNEANATMKDLNGREIALIVPLAVLMIGMGFVPAPFLAKSELAVRSILETVEAKRVAVAGAAPNETVAVEIIWPEAVAAAPLAPTPVPAHTPEAH